MPTLPPPPSVSRALRQAWRALGDDPVRLLTVAMGGLLAEVAFTMVAVAVVAAAWGPPGGTGATTLPPLARRAPILTLCVAWGLRAALVAAVRVALLRRPPPAPDPRASLTATVVRLVAVDALTVVPTWAGAAVAAAPAGVLVVATAAQGLWPAAAVLVGVAMTTGWLGSLPGRAWTLPAVLAVAVDGHALPGAWRAMRHASWSTWSWTVRLLFVTDAARLFGSLLLVAGALPAYPLPLMAARERWRGTGARPALETST